MFRCISHKQATKSIVTTQLSSSTTGPPPLPGPRSFFPRPQPTDLPPISQSSHLWTRMNLQERFFLDARQAFGRTALVLTGGMTLGLFHMGVVKCLYEQGCLPPVICGTSIGVRARFVFAFFRAGTHSLPMHRPNTPTHSCTNPTNQPHSTPLPFASSATHLC